jgi:hypothetical protein
MKLTNEDKQLLEKWGYPDSDFEQIEEALKTTITVYEMNNIKISRAKAIEILGREVWLSGVGRSAFHWSAYRENEEKQGVFFNSSRLFK